MGDNWLNSVRSDQSEVMQCELGLTWPNATGSSLLQCYILHTLLPIRLLASTEANHFKKLHSKSTLQFLIATPGTEFKKSCADHILTKF